MVAKTLSRAVALLLVSSPAAFGLGLGEIRLLSSLNAPLDAEIELVDATPEELASLKTQLASHETFQRYGIDWPGFLASVSAQTARSADGRNVIKLRSSEAITEPFLTLLLEVNWARGKLIREYTVLLDPPVYTPGQPAGAQAPVAAPVSGETPRAGAINRAAPQPAQAQESAPNPSSSAPSAAPAPQASVAAAGSTRIVRRGETLSGIAGEIAGSNPRNSRRWMVAIYRGNPRAFDGNMNILRSGAELQIPETATVEGISTGDASAEIRQQYAAWRGAAPAQEPAAEEPGRLKLVPPSATPGTPGTGTPASSGDSSALQGRVRELEAQLQESRRLIELRNAEVAQLQARLSAKGAQPPATPPPGEETAVEPAPAAETPPATAEAPTAEPAPVAEPAPSAPAAAEQTAAPAPSEEGSLLDKLKQFWWVIAALLVAILGLVGLRAWRAKKEADFDDNLGRLASGSDRDFGTGDTAPVRAIGPEPSFLVEETGTHERPRFAGPAAAAPPNVATEDTISSETAINLDQGDPLAEADFHMAYGLYDQAADLVRIAISREPERRDLKLKLLEVFFVWGNKEQFLQTARELAATREQAAPGEWEKIVIMGKQLAPEDELFGASASLGAAAAGGVDLDLEGGQSRVDFDLLGEPVPGGDDHGAVDLDIGSALSDRDATAESPTRTTDAHLALHDGDEETTATTREITREMPSTDEPAPLMPDYNLDDSEEAPTVEQPAVYGGDNPTIRQKVDMALKQGGGADQTAELAIDDLGLDLTALDTVDQPGLGSSPDAPTLVAGLDEHSRRVMADAEGRGDEDATGPAATGEWRVRPEDLDPTMPPTRVEALEGDISATSRMTTIREQDIDFDFDAEEGAPAPGGSLDLDVGTATVPDMAHTATQRIAAEDLALPDLEPVTMSEVGTKLDLARAYMDMGDPEGARNILEEVLQEGSVTQKQEAQRLIDSLPG